jgi:hypothetical protein
MVRKGLSRTTTQSMLRDNDLYYQQLIIAPTNREQKNAAINKLFSAIIYGVKRSNELLPNLRKENDIFLLNSLLKKVIKKCDKHNIIFRFIPYQADLLHYGSQKTQKIGEYIKEL